MSKRFGSSDASPGVPPDEAPPWLQHFQRATDRLEREITTRWIEPVGAGLVPCIHVHDEAGNVLSVEVNPALNRLANHRAAADTLLAKIRLSGELLSSWALDTVMIHFLLPLPEHLAAVDHASVD